MDEALHYHNISLQLRREAGKQAGIAHSLINIGQIKLEKKQYKEALKNLLEALPATEKQHELFVLEDLYGKIAWAYSGLGEHEKAFLFSQKKASLADSLESTYHRSVELQRLLEAEKQKRVKIEAEAQLELQKSRNSILYTRSVGGVLLLGAALFVLTFWSSRIRAKKELAEKKEQFALLRIDDLMKGQEIQSNYARFEGQEIERKRIAKDLHDRLGSMLATIKLYFKAIDKRAPFLEDSLLAQYDKAKSLLDEACEEIRHISHNLESGGLREYGLVQQIATLAEHLEFSQLLKVHFHTHGLDGRLGPLMEVNIYRIIQELVTNVLKHAKASELTIQLNKFDHTLNIMVEDNGVGFTKEDLLSHKYHGIGIQNIAGRVKELNGQMSIDSGKGGGTTVSIDIPFKN